MQSILILKQMTSSFFKIVSLASFIMKIFEQIAIEVEAQWKQTNYRLEDFPKIATNCLKNFNYDLSKKQLDEALCQWLVKTSLFPEQINLHNQFGQPPITLFNNNRFVVEIYFWLNFDTSIHSHGFRGGFKVLHGHSLHEKFKVNTTTIVSPDLILTELGTPEIELMHAGDTHPIFPDLELTHRVIHLENPTITLCIKTINETDKHQWHYYPNGLAIQKRHLNPNLIKSIYFFEYLLKQNSTISQTFLDSIIGETKLCDQINLCEEIISGAYGLSDTASDLILNFILERHSETEWFHRYEDLNELIKEQLYFEHCDGAYERLLAHLVNCNYGIDTVSKFLKSLTGQDHLSTHKSIIQNLDLLTKDNRFFGNSKKTNEQISKLHKFYEQAVNC